MTDLLDLTGKHPVTKGDKDLRPWERITGITLHQTACRLGTRPERWYTLGAHVGIPKDGQVLLVNALQVKMWHAGGLNRDTVGVEIDGNFCGIEGRPRTAWSGGGGPHELTQEQIEGARWVLRWICQEVEAHGSRITSIYAHRQSSENRTADPGSRIWQEIGLWACQELGLVSNPMETRGSGLSVPVEWDPRSVRDYRGRLVLDRVRWYQALIGFVGIDVDGDHGPNTTKKLKAWQTARGIEATGRVDGPTWAALIQEGGAT